MNAQNMRPAIVNNKKARGFPYKPRFISMGAIDNIDSHLRKE